MIEPPRPIAEAAFDLSFSDEKMRVRIYAPALDVGGAQWSCAYSIDAPVSVEAARRGETSLLALIDAMRQVSRAVYGSVEYRGQQIGVGGRFGGDLFIPATSDLLDIAPYPF